MRRVAIVGSRDYPNLEEVRAYVHGLPPDTVVISGGARGVDTVAVEEARRLGMACEVYPADWSKGRAAGFARNVIIVRQCSELVAFWDGRSAGAAHSIKVARKDGKLVTVFTSP
jgi:hypothetical protein